MVANLRKLRKAKGISQQQLADDLEISQQSINKYENHKIEPDIFMLMKMADYFETSIDYLVGYTDIDRKIEPVQPHDLNADEAAVIENYRTLSPKERESIRLIMENYLDHKA
jgi:transcriptional regulator with XRE-family HTH domain